MLKPKVLSLSVHNSCWSHLAEGFLRHIAGDRFEVASAAAKQMTVRVWSFNATHNLQARVPAEKFLAMYERVLECRLYPLWSIRLKRAGVLQPASGLRTAS